MSILLLGLWLPLCVAVGVFANQRRNRSGLAWFLLSCFVLSPLLSFLFLAILHKRTGPRPFFVPLFLSTAIALAAMYVVHLNFDRLVAMVAS